MNIIYKGYDIIGDGDGVYYVQDFSTLKQPTSRETYPTIEAAKKALDEGKVIFTNAHLGYFDNIQEHEPSTVEEAVAIAGREAQVYTWENCGGYCYSAKNPIDELDAAGYEYCPFCDMDVVLDGRVIPGRVSERGDAGGR